MTWRRTPRAFPDCTRLGLAPWQAERLYIRDFRGGEGTVPTPALEPLRGITIAEIAASALQAHDQGIKQFIDFVLSSHHRSYYSLVKNQYAATGAAADNRYGALFDGLPLPLEPLVLPSTTRVEARAALYTWLKNNAADKEGPPTCRSAGARPIAPPSSRRPSLRPRRRTPSLTPGQNLVVGGPH